MRRLHPEVTERLEEKLEAWLTRLEGEANNFSASRPVDLSEREKERLRGLGYLE